MNSTIPIKLVLKNPITEYLKFVLNFLGNKLQYKKFSQGYLAIIRNSCLESNVKVYDFVKIRNSKIGKYTYVATSCRIGDAKIGKFCSIGPNCIIGTGSHPSKEFVSTHPIFYSAKRQAGTTFSDKNYYDESKTVEIGNDVWIGLNAIVLDSVKIGDGAIIGAGALVNKDVPAYAVFGGVPAKLIRYRFEAGTITFLLEFKWWEKDDNWLKKNYKRFHSIHSFLASFGRDNDFI